MASPLYITSASSQIPLGSGKGGLFINFFSRGNNSTSCHMDFCIQLCRELDFLPTSYPSPPDAQRRGSFVSLDWGGCWFWGSEEGGAGSGESTELRVRCLRPGFPSLLCDVGLGPSLSGPQLLPLPAPRTTSVIYNGVVAPRFPLWNGEPPSSWWWPHHPAHPAPTLAWPLGLGLGLAGVAAGRDT